MYKHICERANNKEKNRLKLTAAAVVVASLCTDLVHCNAMRAHFAPLFLVL